MRRLHRAFPDELTLIGVHTAKFPHERELENVRQAALRLGIFHPVVNDTRSTLWQEFCVRGWPTVVLIDPRGYMIAKNVGELQADRAIDLLRELIARAHQEGSLRLLDPVSDENALANTNRVSVNRTAVDQTAEKHLRFPSKVLCSDGLLWIADSGNHRILATSLPDAEGKSEIQRVLGTGRPGWQDGDLENVRFHHPRGLARRGKTLYVADTDNHAVRAIDLEAGKVSTVLGTGQMGRRIVKRPGFPRTTPLRSPWDLHADQDRLFVAMAGAHQIWILEKEESALVLAGSGREALLNGPAHLAAFNQPSGLTVGGDMLYIADAEASAIRALTFEQPPQVRTLVGRGLFDFGDIDGDAETTRLQHPTDVAWYPSAAGEGLLIADTYNHKIKVLDLATCQVRTLIGTGQPGREDGSFSRARLFEPEGLSLDIERQTLYIADTNNHRIRVADLETETLVSVEFSSD